MLQGVISCIGKRPIYIEHVVKAAIGITRGITASSPACAKKMPDRPALVDESEFTEAFLKGSGPGGQKIVHISPEIPYNPTYVLIPQRTKPLPLSNSNISLPAWF
jgi:hypothetical protein